MMMKTTMQCRHNFLEYSFQAYNAVAVTPIPNAKEIWKVLVRKNDKIEFLPNHPAVSRILQCKL